MDRSDPPVRPATESRPLGHTGRCQFWLSTYAPLFFGKACLPKNILLNQNCLKTMINNISAIICAKGDKQLSAITCSIQVDVETTCFGCHTFFMLIVFAASTCCSIDSLRKCCSLCFWVWDKPEGHHLGCKYLESCFALFSSALLQPVSFLTRLLLATIGLCGEVWFGYIVGYWI